MYKGVDHVIDKVKLGTHIYRLRKQKGFSQKELADKLHISFQAVSKWERGLSTPNFEMISSIANLFNTSANQFLFQAETLMSLDELIDNLNRNGLNDKNYISLAALIQSDLFSDLFIRMITGDKLKTTLNIVMKNLVEYRNISLINASHKLYREYANLFDLNLLSFKEKNINGVKVLVSVTCMDVDYVFLGKHLSRVIESVKKSVILLFHEVDEKITIMTKCTNDLLEEGFNSYYITQLLGWESIIPSTSGILGGGGDEQHGTIEIAKHFTKTDYIDKVTELFESYVLRFNKLFALSLTKL